MANSKVTHSAQANGNRTEMTDSGDKCMKRKWQVYPGRNKFYCNGRCVSSPDYQGFLCCMALIIVTGKLCVPSVTILDNNFFSDLLVHGSSLLWHSLQMLSSKLCSFVLTCFYQTLQQKYPSKGLF